MTTESTDLSATAAPAAPAGPAAPSAPGITRWSPLEWARAHPTAADTLLALLLTGVSLVPLWLGTNGEQHNLPSPWAIVLVLLINLPLALRRRHPLAIVAVVGGAAAVYGIAPYPDLVVPIAPGALVGFYTTISLCSRRTATLVGIGVCATALFSMLLPATNADPVDFTFAALLFGMAWALGASARTRRAYTAELEERAARLERDRELEARRAVAEERARIARELHDVIAHHVSMMVVQAEAGPVVVEHDPGTAARAFDSIGSIGRQALAEMRRLLGVLREDGDRSVPSFAPQPGLEQLPALVDQLRSAGLDAELAVEGSRPELPPGIDLSAYRIVQEALTNALRHGGPGAARVLVRYGDGELLLEVRDHGGGGHGAHGGRGGRGGHGGHRGHGSHGSDHGGGSTELHDRDGTVGHGLVGMRERVHLFDGELRAGPCPDGGFAVAVRLPLPPPA
jgi:signal transduction histidine kinase